MPSAGRSTSFKSGRGTHTRRQLETITPPEQ